LAKREKGISGSSKDLESYLKSRFCHSGLSRIFLYLKKDSRQAGMTAIEFLTIGTVLAINNAGPLSTNRENKQIETPF